MYDLECNNIQKSKRVYDLDESFYLLDKRLYDLNGKFGYKQIIPYEHIK